MNWHLPWLFVVFLALLVACTPQGEQQLASETEAHSDITETVQSPNAASASCNNPVPDDRRFPLPPWPNTNFCLHSVPYEEIRYGGVPKDRIAAIDEPVFQNVPQADLWLADVEPVIFLSLDGESRAYPLQVLVWHEIVNDRVGVKPIVVTYCPLCNSALVFERRLNGMDLDFGTTGNLRQADLVMYDRQTESWWQQFTGEAIVGTMTGQRLLLLPSSIISYGDFKSQFPDGKVLFPDTGLERAYGETPYINYDSLVNPGTKFLDGQADDRLPPKMRVLGLTMDEIAIAYPYSILSEVAVINDTQNGQELVIFWKSGTNSALYKQVIAESKDVGSAAAYSRIVDGQVLTFTQTGEAFADLETGSTWNLLGKAIDGPLVGTQLDQLLAHELLWFAWAAFEPDTILYSQTEA
jgi:hypothetical protein